jgi:hypothetical protein
VLGSAKRLSADGTIPAALRLADSKVSTTGVVMGTYKPAGEVVTGSFCPGPTPCALASARCSTIRASRLRQGEA